MLEGLDKLVELQRLDSQLSTFEDEFSAIPEKRENIAEVLDTGLISKADIIRLRIIAKGRGFEHALTRLGQLSATRNLKNVTLAAKVIGDWPEGL